MTALQKRACGRSAASAVQWDLPFDGVVQFSHWQYHVERESLFAHNAYSVHQVRDVGYAAF